MSTVHLLTQIVISYAKQRDNRLSQTPMFIVYTLQQFYLYHSSKFCDDTPLYKMSRSYSKSLPQQKFAPTPSWYYSKLKTKLRGLSPRANYTDRAAAAGRRS